MSARRQESPEGHLLTVQEAADWLRVSRWSVYSLIHSNQLQTIKIGRRRLVSLDALRQCVEASQRGSGLMARGRQRANGEGSIFPYRTGYAAYVWVTTPDGARRRKWVYGKTREDAHGKWLKLHEAARRGPVATSCPTVGDYLAYWLREVVIPPSYAPLTCATYEIITRLYILPFLGKKRLDRLTLRDVRAWLTKVRDTCQCCEQGKDARRPGEPTALLCQDSGSVLSAPGIRADNPRRLDDPAQRVEQRSDRGTDPQERRQPRARAQAEQAQGEAVDGGRSAPLP